ncbi:50S ribosomal protein L11 methyltransferase [Nostoc sp. CHAB 5784]|uniref:50S ribosomal protein L11 methyltransferase n=1 Tax=Nostoc mirabile TaxID=2907820 RepID=UPI001E6117F6|nr:50S ribosomal protein L11 methyltransferase [Nostoc mirabile]MCC5667053.1 50S ribosomal protein L11 methyltransferase [Nostoc mirabile CHAB5784]
MILGFFPYTPTPSPEAKRLRLRTLTPKSFIPYGFGEILVPFGCGHGALCIDAAISGAQRVIGLDRMGNPNDVGLVTLPNGRHLAIAHT